MSTPPVEAAAQSKQQPFKLPHRYQASHEKLLTTIEGSPFWSKEASVENIHALIHTQLQVMQERNGQGYYRRVVKDLVERDNSNAVLWAVNLGVSYNLPDRSLFAYSLYLKKCLELAQENLGKVRELADKEQHASMLLLGKFIEQALSKELLGVAKLFSQEFALVNKMFHKFLDEENSRIFSYIRHEAENQSDSVELKTIFCLLKAAYQLHEMCFATGYWLAEFKAIFCVTLAMVINRSYKLAGEDQVKADAQVLRYTGAQALIRSIVDIVNGSQNLEIMLKQLEELVNSKKASWALWLSTTEEKTCLDNFAVFIEEMNANVVLADGFALLDTFRSNDVLLPFEGVAYVRELLVKMLQLNAPQTVTVSVESEEEFLLVKSPEEEKLSQQPPLTRSIEQALLELGSIFKVYNLLDIIPRLEKEGILKRDSKFYDPILRCYRIDPVSAPDGNCYDRERLDAWQRRQGVSQPGLFISPDPSNSEPFAVDYVDGKFLRSDEELRSEFLTFVDSQIQEQKQKWQYSAVLARAVAATAASAKQTPARLAASSSGPVFGAAKVTPPSPEVSGESSGLVTATRYSSVKR